MGIGYRQVYIRAVYLTIVAEVQTRGTVPVEEADLQSLAEAQHTAQDSYIILRSACDTNRKTDDVTRWKNVGHDAQIQRFRRQISDLLSKTKITDPLVTGLIFVGRTVEYFLNEGYR
jgi:hypothetical protein